MAYTNVPKSIQINEFTNPFTVIKTVYKKACCNAYLVSWATADGQEKNGIMQVFPPECAAAYHRAKDAFVRVFGRNKVTPFSGTDATEYLLIDLPTRFLQWKTILKQSIQERLRILLKLGEYLSELENHGIVPNGIDIRTIIQQPDGNLCSWDFQNAVIIADAADEDVNHNRRQCALDLTQLTIQAFVGRTVPEVNCLTLLKLALYDRMTLSDQEEILQSLDEYLYSENCADLTPLLDVIELAKMSLEDYEPIVTRNRETSLAAANFLHKNPLWQYVKEGDDGYNHLNILMIGASPMRKAFLDTIIPCAQMLDTRMHIRIVSKDAATFCDRYLRKAPLLRQGAYITHIPPRPRRSYVINELLTGKNRQGEAEPFVYLTFEEAEIPDKDAFRNAGCVFVLDTLTEEMRKTLMDLDDAARYPVLIGLKEAVPQLPSPQKPGSLTVADSFSTAYGAELTKSKIYKKALAVHTFYEKEYNERVSQKDILENFKKRYNRDSSIRAALSIPYKLAAYGLADCKNSSTEFYTEVLQNKDRDPLRRLIWLEHRSWQAFLIINGWSLNTENLENDFAKYHSHKDEGGRWHACLFGSNDTGPEPLSMWTPEDWKSKDLAELDPLDRMSVIIHREYSKYVTETVYGENKDNLNSLINQLSSKLPADRFELLKNAVDAMKADITNSSVGWNRVVNDLKVYLKSEAATGGFDAQKVTDINGILSKLEEHAKFIQKRNERMQYKNLDRAFLEAIPYLLEKDSIRCIYKLWSDEHPWNNMVSAFFVEPDQLCFLYSEEQERPDTKLVESFLCNRRQINPNIEVLKIQDLKKVRTDSVLDVTGADIQWSLMASKRIAELTEKNAKNIPIIRCKDGKLQALDGDCPLINCYRQNQTLTVEELMAITGTKVIAEGMVVPMQQLATPEVLWNAAQECRYYDDRHRCYHNIYNNISNFLGASIEKWEVVPVKESKAKPWRSELIKSKNAVDGGLQNILMSLEENGVISWTDHAVTAKNLACQNSLNQMLKAYVDGDKDKRKHMKLSFKSESANALCVLEYLSTNFNHMVTIDGNKLWFDSEIFVYTSDLITGLDELFSKGLIKQTNNKPLYEETSKDGKKVLHIRFRYADIPTMDCLTKAGNALEALAYHTIRQMNVFDDVKLGVSILWGEQNSSNEIDLVCTKGTNSFFISCKKTKEIKPEHITEIRYETDRFGVNGTAILLTTAQEKESAATYNRARNMGVEIITLSNNPEEDSAAVLRTEIERIVNKTEKKLLLTEPKR